MADEAVHDVVQFVFALNAFEGHAVISHEPLLAAPDIGAKFAVQAGHIGVKAIGQDDAVGRGVLFQLKVAGVAGRSPAGREQYK